VGAEVSIRDIERRVFDRVQLRETALALDTEAENLTDQLALTFGDKRKQRALAERRAEMWRTSALLRKLADGR